jgi:aspartyl protease family protein
LSNELPRTFKITTLWLLLGVVVFLAVQWWQHQQQQSRFEMGDGVIEIRRAPDGHYHWPGHINGRAVQFLVDTGATRTAMSAALAEDLGLRSEGSELSNTAGGVVTGQRVRADVRLQGGLAVRQLRVAALPGLDDRPLLGMDVLGRLALKQEAGVLRIDLRGSP